MTVETCSKTNTVKFSNNATVKKSSYVEDFFGDRIMELYLASRVYKLTNPVLETTVFGDVESCSLKEDYRPFRGACCLNLLGVKCQTARLCIPEDSHYHTRPRENLVTMRLAILALKVKYFDGLYYITSLLSWKP